MFLRTLPTSVLSRQCAIGRLLRLHANVPLVLKSGDEEEHVNFLGFYPNKPISYNRYIGTVGRVNLDAYIKSIEHKLTPPVSNHLMYDEKLKLMVVGGPNKRSDYHIGMGEELFYQLKGDMELLVVVNGLKQRVRIREGDMFLLPAGIPHSPQRSRNSIGLVFERHRSEEEVDCMRWYDKSSPEVESEVAQKTLYEEYFHCANLGTQLKGVIENFHTWKLEHSDKIAPSTSTGPNEVTTVGAGQFAKASVDRLGIWGRHFEQCFGHSSPFSLSERIREAAPKQRKNTSGKSLLFDSEFRVAVLQHFGVEAAQQSVTSNDTSSTVHIIDLLSLGVEELFLWQKSGTSSISFGQSLTAIPAKSIGASSVSESTSVPILIPSGINDYGKEADRAAGAEGEGYHVTTEQQVIELHEGDVVLLKAKWSPQVKQQELHVGDERAAPTAPVTTSSVSESVVITQTRPVDLLLCISNDPCKLYDDVSRA